MQNNPFFCSIWLSDFLSTQLRADVCVCVLNRSHNFIYSQLNKSDLIFETHCEFNKPFTEIMNYFFPLVEAKIKEIESFISFHYILNSNRHYPCFVPIITEVFQRMNLRNFHFLKRNKNPIQIDT